MTRFTQHLQTPEGYKETVKEFDDLLRKQQFDELDQVLRQHLEDSKSEIALICKSIPLGTCRFEQKKWDKLNRDIVRYDKGGDNVAAIGFDLTGHWEGVDPGFEISFYQDRIDDTFQFSQQTHLDLLTKAEYPTPWQGSFIDCDGFGPILGLSRLYSCLQTNRSNLHWTPKASRHGMSKPVPVEFLDYFLGLFFLHLQVQETIFRELKQYGLPKPMPVLLGTHSFIGPYDAYNVFLSTTLMPISTEYDQIMAEDAQIRLRSAKQHAAQQIEQLTRNWMVVRKLGNRKSSLAGQKTVSTLNRFAIVTLGMNSILPEKPVDQMDEHEFKNLMEEYYRTRLKKAQRTF